MKKPPPPPTQIGEKYRVIRVLGEGGGGLVVEAEHVDFGKRVAIKLLRGKNATSSDAVTRFLREARAAGSLVSEHIARVSDVGTLATGEPYQVMELLVGRDLEAELSERGPIPVTDAVDWILQASKGLAEAHANGLVHRDIKPANLFLTRRKTDGSPIVKVLDFGLSKAPEKQLSITHSASILGTPQYMAPEQLRSSKHVDARADQHALALVLFELIAGEPAFQGETTTQLLVAIGLEEARRVSTIVPSVPASLDDAIARALSKKPEERFYDLAAFARAIAPSGGPQAAASAAAIGEALRGRDIGVHEDMTVAESETEPPPPPDPSSAATPISMGSLPTNTLPLEDARTVTARLEPPEEIPTLQKLTPPSLPPPPAVIEAVAPPRAPEISSPAIPVGDPRKTALRLTLGITLAALVAAIVLIIAVRHGNADDESSDRRSGVLPMPSDSSAPSWSPSSSPPPSSDAPSATTHKLLAPLDTTTAPPEASEPVPSPSASADAPPDTVEPSEPDPPPQPTRPRHHGPKKPPSPRDVFGGK